jgi:hypothetical protein
VTRNLESRGNPANREPNRVATVGQLRAALEGIPDDTPADCERLGPGLPQGRRRAGEHEHRLRLADWGDSYGLEPDNLFALNCHIADTDPRRKPARKATP